MVLPQAVLANGKSSIKCLGSNFLGTLCSRKWVFALHLLALAQALVVNGQSSPKCLGPDFSATCAIGDGRDGVETITGRAHPHEAREGVFHIKDIKFTVSNTPCLNYTAGCWYGGPTSDTATKVGCTVDEAGTWEECEVVYCSDLPFCDPGLQAIADDTSVLSKVQVYTAREYVNALINNRVEEILIMERILVSDAVLPPVPITIRRYVHVKPAANAIYLIMNVSMWSQIIVSRLGFYRCTSCAITAYAADWAASMKISHPFSPLPHTVLERGGVVNMDEVTLLTDCFALDPEGMKLAPKLSKFEEPFTRGAPGDDHQDREPLTELDVKRIAPIAPENRDPADPPLGVLRYWISSNFMVSVGNGLMQNRDPRVTCFEWVQTELWTESYRNSPPPPPTREQGALDNSLASDNKEIGWGVWLGVVVGFLFLGAGCALVAWRRRALQSAAKGMNQDCSLLLVQTQAMLDIYASAVSAHPSPGTVETSAHDQEGDLTLQWTQMGELLRLSQPVIPEDIKISAEGSSVAPIGLSGDGTASTESYTRTSMNSGHDAVSGKMATDSNLDSEAEVVVVEAEGGESSANNVNEDPKVDSELGTLASGATDAISRSRKFVLGPLNLTSVQNLVLDSGLNSYVVHELVGSGAFATCYRATNVETNQPVALKMAKFTKHDVDLKCEAELLGTLHHPHVVMLIESFVYQNRQVLILEWCAGGDLNAESKIEASAVDEEFVWQVAAQLTLAVAHLHAQKMVHRDIKMGNVFLTGHGDIKVDPRTPRALR
mmetsp:Transcript_15394/g.29598  ORF Transcript_15394/g.29598 Transcript_15394/m.29598 type:complete len:775 (-) Transcript_15394:1141-3465(-)